MTKLAYNSNGFLKRELLDAIDTLHGIGYTAIEIALNRNHLDPTYHSSKYIENIKTKLAEKDFQIVAIHTGANDIGSEIDFEPSLISSEKRDRQKRINFIKQSIDLAADLDVKLVTVTSGIQRKAVSDNTAQKYLFESMDQILSYASGKTDILIENEVGMYICSTEDVLNLLQYYPKELGVTFDIGHSECCRENICESIKKLGSKIRHMHFEDIKDNVHNHMLPGDGDINFREVIKQIEQSQYEGYCSVELYPYNDKPEYAALKSFLYLDNLNR